MKKEIDKNNQLSTSTHTANAWVLVGSAPPTASKSEGDALAYARDRWCTDDTSVLVQRAVCELQELHACERANAQIIGDLHTLVVTLRKELAALRVAHAERDGKAF